MRGGERETESGRGRENERTEKWGQSERERVRESER